MSYLKDRIILVMIFKGFPFFLGIVVTIGIIYGVFEINLENLPDNIKAWLK